MTPLFFVHSPSETFHVQPMKQSPLLHLSIFMVGWTALNLIQAGTTELLHDEAYYWLWQHDHPLAIGYFDHPPGIALMIRIGCLLTGGELGVRLAGTVLSTLTLLILYMLTDTRRPWLFAALVSSIAVVHIGGFVAVPDIPLMFFATLFFLALKRSLQEDTPFNAALFIISLAGMAYSKYNGVLIPVFALLGSPRLFRRRSLWIVILTTALLIAPHLHWQWVHDFPTFRYHLFDRGQRPWRIGFLWEFLGSQLLVFGPLMAPLLFWTAFRASAKSDFERSMKWAMIGTFVFFLLQSLRKPAEANWTVLMVIPMVFFTLREADSHRQLRKTILWLTGPSLILLLAFRLFLAWNYLPSMTNLRNEFHGWDQWARQIAGMAGDRPVIFENSYQKASKYTFYSGQPSFSINTMDYAGKQHDLWIKDAEALEGQDVLHFYPGAPDSILLEPSGQETYEFISGFRSLHSLRLELPHRHISAPPDTFTEVQATLFNAGSRTVHFPKDSTTLEYGLFWYGQPQDTIPILPVWLIDSIRPAERIPIRLLLPTPPVPGDHWRFRLSLRYRHILGRNSHFYEWKCK
jgi:4-amino-4-deoxy-L-arabinose transferase-like glycosyltransferase